MKQIIFIATIFSILQVTVFPQNKNIVVLVGQDSEKYNRLSQSEQLYARSALQTFVENLTLINGISVRTDYNDAVLRQVQKKSQVDASKGLGSEKSAYASDLVSKADLFINFSLARYKQGYKLEYSASEIESLKIISSSSSIYFQIEKISEETDKLSYTALRDLNAKGFIQSVPYNVRLQLNHESDSSANYAKYISDLAKQIEKDTAELERIKSENQEKAASLEEVRKEQALRLKIQAAENARKKTEESLKRQQDEIEKQKKQAEELKSLTEQKRNALALKFEETIKKSQEQQQKLNKELGQGLSIEKRAELIENDRQTLNELLSQLNQKKHDNEQELYKKLNAEIQMINDEPWQLGQLDGSGKPTQNAVAFKNAKIQKVINKYGALIADTNSNLDAAFLPAINSYNKQISDGIKDLEKTDFVYRSYESGSPLRIAVGDYNGATHEWPVSIAFNMKETNLIKNIPDLSFVYCKISYKGVTGKASIDFNGTNEAEYSDYIDDVQLADLCFRTDTPYVYGELHLKAKYDLVTGTWSLLFNRFDIKKMEDQRLVSTVTGVQYKKQSKAHLAEQEAERQLEEQQRLAEEFERRRKELVEEAERQRELAEEEAERKRQEAERRRQAEEREKRRQEDERQLKNYEYFEKIKKSVSFFYYHIDFSLDVNIVGKTVQERFLNMRRAVELGSPFAAYCLGQSYEYGENGFGKNKNEALKWLNKAKELCNDEDRRIGLFTHIEWHLNYLK